MNFILSILPEKEDNYTSFQLNFRLMSCKESTEIYMQ